MQVETLKKKLNSGANLEVWYASFREGHTLFKAVNREIEGLDFKTEFEKISLRLITSEPIEAALWPCLYKATYNGQKITEQLFEDLNIRRDFLEVQKEVLMFNLSVFIKGLASPSSAPASQSSTESQP